jgi:hypothetical protein
MKRRTYRTCSKCSMRREFDLERWRMKGRYYREPVDQSQAHFAQSGRKP